MVCHGSQFYSTLQEWQDSRNGIYNLIFKLDKRTDGVMNVNIERTTYEVWKNTDQIFSLIQVLQQKRRKDKNENVDFCLCIEPSCCVSDIYFQNYW